MLKENLKTVEERIQSACKKAGRKREEITLIAVSKTKLIISGFYRNFFFFQNRYCNHPETAYQPIGSTGNGRLSFSSG